MLRRPRPKNELVKEMRGDDSAERDQILAAALAHLSSRHVEYVPLALEEDVEASYEDDSLEEFRRIVRGWVKELVRAQRGAA